MLNWIPLTSLSLRLDYAALRSGAGRLSAHQRRPACARERWRSTLAFARITGAPGRSAFVAAVFALHPLHVESVAWVSERKDVLSGLFFMLGLLALRRATRSALARARLRATTLLCALGLLSQADAWSTFPCVLLLLDAWPLGRLARRGRAGRCALRGGASLLEKLPMLAPRVAVFAALTFALQRRRGRHACARGASRSPRALAQCARGLRRCMRRRRFWPSGLTVLLSPPASAPRLGPEPSPRRCSCSRVSAWWRGSRARGRTSPSAGSGSWACWSP